MPGILYVVATPIGNLEDVTLRALRILSEVSTIAAEDTRRTARLLQHYSISTRTTSLHEHNEREKSPRLIEKLLAGQSVALVSDAGTPLISDPGRSLVSAARAAGIRVEAVPGASAVMAAISASGFDSRQFIFLGFPPFRSKDRKAWLREALAQNRLIVFFEAPHRIQATLSDLNDLSPDRTIGVARELTKIHEELVIRPISAVLGYFHTPKGEFTILIPPLDPTSGASASTLPPVSDETLISDFCYLTNFGQSSRRDAVRGLAGRYGLSVNDVYRRLQGHQD